MDSNSAISLSDQLLKRAESVLRSRWEGDRSNWEFAWKLAEVLRQLGRLGEALEFYCLTLKINPSFAPAQYAVFLFGKRKYPGKFSQGIVPVPFAAKHNVLEAVQIETIWDCIRANKKKFIASGIANQKNASYRHSSYVGEADLVLIAEIIDRCVTRELRSAWSILGVPEFEVANQEMQITAHSAGQFYNAHRDVGTDQKYQSRVITYVLYVFKEPKKFSGGDLILYDWDGKYEAHLSKFTRITPQNNLLLLFPSAALHQVTMVQQKQCDFEDGRFTVNGWLHASPRANSPDV